MFAVQSRTHKMCLHAAGHFTRKPLCAEAADDHHHGGRHKTTQFLVMFRGHIGDDGACQMNIFTIK